MVWMMLGFCAIFAATGIGFLLAANEVPRIAQVFGLDTGVKVNMTSVMHTTTTAVNLTKTLAKK